MSINEIERALRELRLSGIADTLSTRVMQAQSSQRPFLETLAAMLQDEFDRRRSRLTERRFKHSRLDERPTLVDFDWRFNPKLPRQTCFELHTLKFIGEGANAFIIGKRAPGSRTSRRRSPTSPPCRATTCATSRPTPSSRASRCRRRRSKRR